MKCILALVAALGMTGCCSTPTPPAAAPVAAPCAPAAPKAVAPAAAPFGCNSNAKAATPSPVAMSTVTMPTVAAKALAVPPGVVTCLIGFGKCLIETLISPLKP